ncbi:MAG: DUF3365 domain-containing protein [Nitrospinales bacterium]
MFKPALKFILTSALAITLLLSCDYNLSWAKHISRTTGVPARLATDYIFAVIKANRTFYAKQIVDRLQKKNVIRASENWRQDDTLLLPAQFLKLSSRASNSRGVGMRYRSISLWPINPENLPRSKFKEVGLQQVIENPEKPFTWIIQREGMWYFQAIYPDLALSESCVTCHNGHPKSTKKDFKVGDVMGGIAIDLPLGRHMKHIEKTEFLLPPEIVADYIHSVIESDRIIYGKYIVDRLQSKNILYATEHWKEKNALPLPAQFLSNATALIEEDHVLVDCRLISLWPINAHNAPANEFERLGLESVDIHPLRPYTAHTKRGKTRYFQAVFPDFAITQACVNCHNAYLKGKKHVFKLNDVMGGIVVAFPIQ